MLNRQSVGVLYHTTELVARFKGERDDFLKQHICFSHLKQYREILLRPYTLTNRRHSKQSSSPYGVFTS